MDLLHIIFYYVFNIFVVSVLIYLYYLNRCEYKKLSVLLNTSWKGVMIKTIILIIGVLLGVYIFFNTLYTVAEFISGPDANIFTYAAPIVITTLLISLFVQTLFLKKYKQKLTDNSSNSKNDFIKK